MLERERKDLVQTMSVLHNGMTCLESTRLCLKQGLFCGVEQMAVSADAVLA
jgi:hypothetical protein